MHVRIHPDASAHDDDGAKANKKPVLDTQGSRDFARKPSNISRTSSLGRAAVGLRPSGLQPKAAPSSSEAWIVLPDTTWWKWWNYLTVFSAMMTGVVEPFKIAFTNTAFNFPGSDFWAVQDFISTSIFLMDMCFRFLVASHDPESGVLATDVPGIARNYLNGMMFWDFLFTFPFDWIILAAISGTGADVTSGWVLTNSTNSTNADEGALLNATGGANELWVPSVSNLPLWISTIKFVKMGRMYRVFLFFELLDKKMVVSEIVLMLVRNWMYLLYSAHSAACIFYLIARLESFGEHSWVGRAWDRMADANVMSRYIYSLYISVTSFAGSMGDNDFYEASVAEAAFMIVYCLLNVVLSAYILGTVTMLMVKFDERSKALRDKKTNLIEFKKMHGVPDPLFNAMADHLEMHFNSEQTADENVLQVYPATIRRKVLRQLYLVKLRDCYLFPSCSSKFLDAFLAASRVEIFMPNVELLQVGDIVQELFVVMEGEVRVQLSMRAADAAAARISEMGHNTFNNAGGGVYGAAGGDGSGGGAASMTRGRSLTRQTSGAGSVVNLEEEDKHWGARSLARVKSFFGQGTTRRVTRNGSLTSSLTRNNSGSGEESISWDMRCASECFGEVAFFTEMPSPEAAVTATVSRILVMSKGAFESLTLKFPVASRSCLQALLKQSEKTLEVLLNKRMVLTEEERALVLSDHRMGKLNMAPGVADNGDAVDELLAKLPSAQAMQVETLRNLRQAAWQANEQLSLSRANKLLTNVATGNVHEVKVMLGQGMHPDTSASHDKKTGLMIAAAQGHLSMCQLLLSSGANPMARDTLSHTALYYAVQAAQDDVITLLRQYKASLRGEFSIAAADLCMAVRIGDAVRLRRLLHAGVDVDSSDYDLRTALHVAAAEGDLKLVQILVEEGGAEVDLKDRHGFTPQDEAINSKRQNVADYLKPLMEAAPELRSNLVFQALATKWLGAAGTGNVALVDEMLLIEDIDPDLSGPDGAGRTAMMVAAEAGHEEIILRLLHAGADSGVRDLYGFTALYHAARAGREELVEELVARGVTLAMDPPLVTFQLCMAATQEDEVSLLFLRCMIKAGADISAPLLGFGASPLHCAAAADCVAAMELLLEAPGLNKLEALESKTPWGTTALEEAERAGAERAAALLREHSARPSGGSRRGSVESHNGGGAGISALLDHGFGAGMVQHLNPSRAVTRVNSHTGSTAATAFKAHRRSEQADEEDDNESEHVPQLRGVSGTLSVLQAAARAAAAAAAAADGAAPASFTSAKGGEGSGQVRVQQLTFSQHLDVGGASRDSDRSSGAALQGTRPREALVSRAGSGVSGPISRRASVVSFSTPKAGAFERGQTSPSKVAAAVERSSGSFLGSRAVGCPRAGSGTAARQPASMRRDLAVQGGRRTSISAMPSPTDAAQAARRRRASWFMLYGSEHDDPHSHTGETSDLERLVEEQCPPAAPSPPPTVLASVPASRATDTAALELLGASGRLALGAGVGPPRKAPGLPSSEEDDGGSSLAASLARVEESMAGVMGPPPASKGRGQSPVPSLQLPVGQAQAVGGAPSRSMLSRGKLAQQQQQQSQAVADAAAELLTARDIELDTTMAGNGNGDDNYGNGTAAPAATALAAAALSPDPGSAALSGASHVSDLEAQLDALAAGTGAARGGGAAAHENGRGSAVAEGEHELDKLMHLLKRGTDGSAAALV